MLPKFLESTYKRYKKDTSTFLKWLRESGEKCGYKIDTSVEQTDKVTLKAPKLKGRARKLAKEAAASNASSKSATVPVSKDNPVQIPMKQLLPLAQAIANCDSPLITVPTGILQAGIRAVSQRKRFTDYFANNAELDAKITRSNESHSYFTSLLEQVMETLKHRLPDITQSSRVPASTKNILADLETQFSSHTLIPTVGVEQSEEENTGSTSIPGETDADQIYYLEAPSDRVNRDEDKAFAIFCLLNDFHELRNAIRSAWIKYLIGVSDLITASTITSTAFQLAIRTQEELLADFPDAGDYEMVLTTLMSMIEQTSGESENSDEVEIDDRIADWIFAPAHSALDSFCEILRPGEVPLMKRGHLGIYDPSANRKARSEAENHLQDAILLMEILPEFALLHGYKIDLFAEDELTKGLRKMCKDKQIPIWLPFATTSFLDIHHLMKDKAHLPSVELLDMGKLAVGTLERYFQFSQSIPDPSTWPKENSGQLHNICDAFKATVINDPIWPSKDKNYRKANTIPENSEIFYLYRGHPILCGLIKYRVQLEMQHAGIILCNAWGTVMYPAHLYNALRQINGNPVSSWPLMDRIIEIHGEDRIFVGGRPKNIQDSCKQITLVLGYSAENFAKNRRKTTPVVSKNGPRGLNTTSVISEIFRHGLSDGGSMALTMHNIEALFNEQAKTVDLDLKGSKDKKHLQELRQGWAKTKRLSSLELLEALGASLPQEVRQLEVNYFQMHEQSITLLRNLNVSLRLDFEKYVGKDYIENESQLPFVGAYIVTISSQSRKTAELSGINSSESKVLLKAAEVLEKFLKSEDIREEVVK